MSISLYSEVSRARPLSDAERRMVEAKADAYNRKPDIKRLVTEGGGELFSFHFVDDPSGLVMKSAVKLPVGLSGSRLDDFIHVAETWLDLLSEVRCALDDTRWTVTLDSEPIPWREAEQKFDIPI